MHTLVRRYIKTAVGFLISGLLLGAWMILQRELGDGASSAMLISAHTHLLLVGFVMFMILGVGQWIFPRPAKDDARYQPRTAEVVYWVLTLSTVIRAAAEIARAGSSGMWLRWLVVLGSLGQVAGLALYFWVMRSRIRPGGSEQREKRGERF